MEGNLITDVVKGIGKGVRDSVPAISKTINTVDKVKRMVERSKKQKFAKTKSEKKKAMKQMGLSE